jgi:ATPase family associated with various cellular activities (AAA)
MDWLSRFHALFPGFNLPVEILDRLALSAGVAAVVGEDAVDACRALSESSSIKPLKLESIESVKTFVAVLEGIATDCVMVASGLEDAPLRKRDVALLEDALSYQKGRWRSLGLRVLVLFPMSSKMGICASFDAVIELPGLPYDRLALLSALLPDQLPIASECNRTGILEALSALSRFWTRSDMIKLVKHSCLLAMADDQPLSCQHVSQAHRLLFNPNRCEHIGVLSIQPASNVHRCSIIPKTAIGDTFEGSQAAVESAVSVASRTGVRLVAIAGLAGSGKTMLAKLLATHAAPDMPLDFVKAADVLCAVVGESEKRLAKLLTGRRALVVEDAEQLFPAELSETTGAVQRLLLVLLHGLHHLVNPDDCLIVLTTRDEALLHPRLVKRLACSLRLDDELSEESRDRLFRNWMGEGGIRAIRRFINKEDPVAVASLLVDDFK